MSGVQPSAKDNGIVESVLATLLGLVLFALGIGVHFYFPRAEPMIVLFMAGIGLVVTAMAAHSTWKTVQDLKEAGVTDPVEVLKADMNERGEILKGLLWIALFWLGGGVLWAVFITTPAEASRMLAEIARSSPELVAGWVVVNVVFVIGVVFGSYRGSPTTGGGV